MKYSNNFSGKQLKLWNINSSEKEITDLIKAWVAVSAAFAIVLSSNFSDLYSKFIIASLTVGTGFLLHEMGHKFVAQRYGCFAEFRSFDQMLVLAIAMSFFGFIMAAPGAVMISGRINERKNGKISAAGPIVNLILALLFLMLGFLGPPAILKQVAAYGFMVNSYLALFNMIPFWIFDGQKIIKWNKAAYFAILAVCIAFMMLRGFVAI